MSLLLTSALGASADPVVELTFCVVTDVDVESVGAIVHGLGLGFGATTFALSSDPG